MVLVDDECEGCHGITYGARWDVAELGRANGGQSGEGGDGEGLHFDGCLGVDTVIGVVKVL